MARSSRRPTATAKWRAKKGCHSVTGWSKPAPAVAPKPAITKVLPPQGLISNAWRWGAGVISAGAGLVSILSYTHSLKSKFEADSLGVTNVRWVGVTPTADTATSIGGSMLPTVIVAGTRRDVMGGAPT